MGHTNRVYLVVTVFLLAGIALAATPGANAGAGSVRTVATDTSYWQIQSIGIANPTINVVSAVDRNVCWLAGDAGEILVTSNGGNTWSQVNSGPLGSQNIQVFEGVTDSIAFASTQQFNAVFMYRTTNRGTSWSEVYSQPIGLIRAIKMFTPMKGIAVGDAVGGYWTVLKTTNGGQSWFHIASEPPVIGVGTGGRSFGTLDTTHVWFLNPNGYRYLSSDRGETWNVSTDFFGIHLFWMNTPDIQVAVDGSNVIFGTTNGGATWSTFAAFVPAFPGTGLVGVRGTNEFWFVFSYIFYSADGRYSWENVPPHGLRKSARWIDMAMVGTGLSGWATGVRDTVYHYTRTTIEVEETTKTQPETFALLQNYPNPFNPNTTITYDLPRHSQVVLSVFDILGREVAHLVDGVQEAGRHQKTFFADGLASGVYIYRLKANGFIQYRKMMLEK